MDLAKHCELCDHQQVDFVHGTTCMLTQKKPSFNRTCSKIQLRSKFEGKLEAVNVKYEEVKRTKITAYIYLVVFLIISAAVVFLGYAIAKFALEVAVLSTIPIIIYAISGYLVFIAFSPLSTYRKEIVVAKSNKEKMDAMLSLYTISYTFDVKFGEKIHGEQQYKAILDIKGVR